MVRRLQIYGSIGAVSLSVFLSLALTSLAQDAEGTVRERIEERAEVRTEQRTERREMLETQLQERIVNLTANVTARLTGVIDRFGNIIVRLDARVAKLQALGVDTSRGEAKLSEAKRLLVDTSLTLENLGSVHRAVSGSTPRESFQAIKREILSVREGLRGVQALLRETVMLLKEAVREAELGRGVSEAVRENGTEPEPAPVTNE